MMSQFEETMGSGAMELDADRIMKTSNTFGIEKKTKEINSGNDPGPKSFTMPLKQMSCGCSICGKTSQNGVGGICKGCWNQFQAKGVRIGNISEFEQFTEAVKNQVSRITIVDDNKTTNGQEKLMENIRQIVPAIFSKSEADPASKRSLHVENDPNPKPGGMTRSKTFAYLKPEDIRADKDTQKLSSPTKMKRATTGISLNKPGAPSKSLGSRKSTTAVPDRKTQRKDLPPSTSSSTASYKEVYTPVTVDKSKFLAISLEQIEQRNRKMQLAANKSRSSKIRSKTSVKKKSYKNDPLNMMNSGKNALKRMACDRKRNSGSEDDDEDDDIDNVPSLANQNKLLKRPQRSPRLRTEYTPRILDYDHGSRSQEEKAQPRPRPNLERYGQYNMDNDKDRERQKPSEAHRKPPAVSNQAANQGESAYYQTPAEAKSIRSAISKSDYFMPTIQEKAAQDEATYFDQPQSRPRATQSMPIKNNQKPSIEMKKDVNDYMAYKQGYRGASVTNNLFSESGDLTKKIESAFGASDNPAAVKSIEGKGDNDYYTVTKDKTQDQGGDLYTIAKQFPVAASLAQDTYFEPYNGRSNTTTTAAQPFRVGGSVNLMIGDNKMEQIRPVEKSDDYYTGGIGPMNAKSSSSVKEIYSNGAIPPVSNILPIKQNTESIYADDGNYFKTKPYAIQETAYFGSEKNAAAPKPSIPEVSSYFGSETSIAPSIPSIPEVPSAASDSDCYTGALFSAAQFRTTSSSKTETNLAIDSRPSSSNRLGSSVGVMSKDVNSQILEPTLPSTDSVAAAPDSVGSTARMLRKQRLNLDSILDNSVSSAGEFFSKAVMSFGNHNNHSNQTPCNEAICGSSGSSFNEDQLDFGELARKMPAEYVDWPQGLRPNYGCLEQNKGPTVSTRAFDVNYKKYDDLEWQNNEEEQAQRAQWVNDKQDLAVYGKQAALTWDGRPWSETVEERQQLQMMQMMRSRSPFGKRRPFVSAEKKDPCKVCPNSNNSWTYSDTTWVEVGDVNNNYPNYEMYDRPAPPPQQQRAAQAAPIPCCEDDYAPCIYAPPAAQEHLLARPRQPEPVQQQRNYSSSYGQMGMGNSQESAYFGSTGGSYGYMRYEEQPQPEVVIKREPTPPPVPRIYKVGAINVGYKVENNDDYAENINRDLGHDESMGFPGGVQFNDLSSYGRAFAFPTSQVMEPPPVEPRHKPMERERSHKPRDTRERSFAPRETKKSSSYSHKTYDDTEERKPWAAQNKSLTDVRQKNEESRRRGNNKTSEKKPRRSASQGREASYVHRPSAGGDHVRSAKPQTWEERSFKPERKHYRKDEKKNVEQTANDGKTNSGFGRKIGRIFRLCD